MRFSTWPSAATRITSARPEPSEANSICLMALSDFGASTMPAAWLRPDSMAEASAKVSCRLRPVRLELAADHLALVIRKVPELQQAVHEQTQAAIGGEAAGAGVGGEQQAGLGEVRHDVAYCGRREGDWQAARERAAADRLAGADVLLDDFAQDGGGAGVQAGGEWLGCEVHRGEYSAGRLQMCEAG